MLQIPIRTGEAGEQLPPLREADLKRECTSLQRGIFACANIKDIFNEILMQQLLDALNSPDVRHYGSIDFYGKQKFFAEVRVTTAAANHCCVGRCEQTATGGGTLNSIRSTFRGRTSRSLPRGKELVCQRGNSQREGDALFPVCMIQLLQNYITL